MSGNGCLCRPLSASFVQLVVAVVPVAVFCRTCSAVPMCVGNEGTVIIQPLLALNAKDLEVYSIWFVKEFPKQVSRWKKRRFQLKGLCNFARHVTPLFFMTDRRLFCFLLWIHSSAMGFGQSYAQSVSYFLYMFVRNTGLFFVSNAENKAIE